MRVVQRVTAILLALFILAATSGSQSLAHGASSLPARLTDREFWDLTQQLSEPNGFFRYDNLLSNERGYQVVIPDLIKRVKPGAVYIGVGPEQNFPYIVALKAQMAFIIDIRRGNLLEQLLYKSLFEMSDDRADFLSRLFSRERPAGLTVESTVAQLFAAYDGVPPSEELYKQNLLSSIEWLRTKHQFPMNEADVVGIAHVYHDGFFANGPRLNYTMRAGGGRNMPTYEQLMLATDAFRENRGYLATEANFAFLKDLEARNLIIPVVGDFGGPKAIRQVGKYVKEHEGVVGAFYVSNVEGFLEHDGKWTNFCESVAALPLDDTSTYIYSGIGAPAPDSLGAFGFGPGGLWTSIRPMLAEVSSCPSPVR